MLENDTEGSRATWMEEKLSCSYCWQSQKQHKELKLFGLFIFKHMDCNARLIKRIHFHHMQDLFTAVLSGLNTDTSAAQGEHINCRNSKHTSLKEGNVTQMAELYS